MSYDPVVRKGALTYPCAQAIEPCRRLKLVSGQWDYAGAADRHIAVSAGRTFNAGELLAGVLVDQDKSMRLSAAVAIGDGVAIYGAANGQIGVTNTNYLVGMSLEAASGANALIETLYTRD